MKALFGSSLSKDLCLFPLILKSGFPFESLLFLPLEIKVLVSLLEVIDKAGFGLLKVIFHHASHSVELLGLLRVEALLVFLLLSFLFLFFYLLVEPLFLFVFEELSSCVIL